MPQMLDQHRMFLQAFMSRGSLDGREVKDLYKTICEKEGIDCDVNQLADFTVNINASIRPFHMEIKKGLAEDDCTNFYCLVNLEDSDISRMASHYNPTELEFFKKVLEEIICGNQDGTLSSTDALNLVEDLPGKIMRKKDAEALIEKLCEERWLMRKDGRIMLTPRTLMEFDLYIQEQYPDDRVVCELCHKITVKGQNCSDCAVRVHIHCARKYFKPENMKCPTCGATWLHDVSKPAKALKSTPEKAGEPQPETSRESRRSSRR